MRCITLTLIVALTLAAKDDKQKTTERMDDAATLFSEIMGAPDQSIPQDLVDKSHSIVLVPGLKKGAFVIGGKYAGGFSVCRNTIGLALCSAAAIDVEGGIFGLQIGFPSSDAILLVMI